MISYTFQVYPTKIENHNNLENVVKILALNIIADDTENNIRRIKTVNVDLNNPSVEQFESYENLTEEQVLQWAINALSEEKLESLKESLKLEINNIIENVGVKSDGSIVPPWVNISGE